ncbi:hypothetical protein TNCV_3469901 [Trichonephila clavipes]|nr:hypothetical protein TNCV_3469901 [Trichonephila clavipes]
MLVTVRFCSVPLQFRGEYSESDQRPPTSLPLPSNSQEDLRFDGYLELPDAMKALYINKHPCLLRDSNPDPTAPQIGPNLDSNEDIGMNERDYQESEESQMRFLLGVWTVNSPQSHIVRVYDDGHGKSGVFHSAEWHDGDWSSDGIREA